MLYIINNEKQRTLFGYLDNRISSQLYASYVRH